MRWQLAFWRHPEWWSLVLSAAAWLAIAAAALTPGGHADHAHGGHEAAPSLVALNWLNMTSAMMFPMLIAPVRFVAARSLWRMRNRAIVLFLAGYCAVWLGYGVAVETLVTPQRGESRLFLALTFLVAAAWQWTPLKKSGLRRCHRTAPLAPAGIRASLDCLRYGLTIGGNCWLSCWALMLVCAAAGHSLWAMIPATAVIWMERAWPNQLRGLAWRLAGRQIELAR